MDDRTNDLKPSFKFYNVVVLGIAFMLMFTGFQTCGMVEQTILNSYINETSNSTTPFSGSGYTSLAIIYIVFAFANWIAPSVVSILGPKASMICGGITYTLYLSSFIKPLAATLYTGSVIVGIGAAVLWTAQGNFLTLNSDEETMGRNSGIFWALLQCSLLIGNIYVFFSWQGVTTIGDKQRIPLMIGLTSVCALGTVTFFILKSRKTKPSESEENGEPVETSALQDESDMSVLLNEANDSVTTEGKTSKAVTAWVAFLTSVRLFKSLDMLLLSVTFFYTGLELTFFSSVYSTSVGATKSFGSDSDKLVGLTGILIGVGEIFGGALFGLFGKKTIRYGRDPVILLGGVVHLLTFFLIFLNIPDQAPIASNGTHGTAYISPSKELAIACGFLLGFSDACFNTQCYSIIGSKYAENSAPAFALFKFEQSLAAAIGFFCSSHLVLKWQLVILICFDVAGVISFFIVERKLLNDTQTEYANIDTETSPVK